jgi:TorA maturation chaperone TorD
VYSLLLKTPTKTVVGALVTGDIFDDVEAILSELGFEASSELSGIPAARTYCSTQSSDDLLHELRRDYTQLFIRTSNLPKVPIYESAFETMDDPSTQPLLFVNEKALELSALYKTVGLVRNREFNNSEDHFAFQFEFLSKLHQVLSVAEGEDEYKRFEAIARDYCEKHLSVWMTAFFSACEKESRTEVYRAFWRLGRSTFGGILDRVGVS